MVKCGVLFEVRTEFLNFVYTDIVFKGLSRASVPNTVPTFELKY
jgi:hypothetical protein